jgi:hypothetical protein
MQHAATQLDPLKHVLKQDGADSTMQTLLYTDKACSRLSIIAACCGHLLDDLTGHEKPAPGWCNHCNKPVDSRSKPRESPWTAIWHSLVECPENPKRQEALAIFQVEISELALGSDTYHSQLTSLFDRMRSGCIATAETRQDFLQLITDPAGYLDPPVALHTQILQAVGRMLHPRDKVEGGGEDQDASNKPGASTQKPEQAHSTTQRSGAEQREVLQGCQLRGTARLHNPRSRVEFVDKARGSLEVSPMACLLGR